MMMCSPGWAVSKETVTVGKSVEMHPQVSEDPAWRKMAKVRPWTGSMSGGRL